MAFRERFKWIVNGAVYSVYGSSATLLQKAIEEIDKRALVERYAK